MRWQTMPKVLWSDTPLESKENVDHLKRGAHSTSRRQAKTCGFFVLTIIGIILVLLRKARKAEAVAKLAANDIRVPIVGNDLDVTSFLAKQAVKASSKLHVKAIITDSFTGRTARSDMVVYYSRSKRIDLLRLQGP